jgi:hypothetical protein
MDAVEMIHVSLHHPPDRVREGGFLHSLLEALGRLTSTGPPYPRLASRLGEPLQEGQTVDPAHGGEQPKPGLRTGCDMQREQVGKAVG